MSFDRREFLGQVVGGALWAALPSQAAVAADQVVRKPKPSMNSHFDRAIPFPDVLAMIHDVGFEMISIADPKYSSYDTPAGLSIIEKLLHQYDLKVDWIHAPFPQGDQLFSLDEGVRQKSIQQCRNALDAANALGASAVAVHLLLPYGIPHGAERDRMIVQGMESIKVLEEYAAGKKVRIGLENGQKKDYDEVLMKCLDHFTSDTIGLTYDSGHENVKDPGFHILEKYASRLYILHLHDNPGKADMHQLPYEGTINWDRFAEVMRRNQIYTGTLGLEVHVKNSKFKGDSKLFLVEAKERIDRIYNSI